MLLGYGAKVGLGNMRVKAENRMVTSEQKENEYLLEKLFHYNTLVNYGKSYFSHDDLEKVRMDFMSFASHIL